MIQEAKTIVLKRIGQRDVFVDYDYRVSVGDLADLYVRGGEVLSEIGTKLNSLWEPLGPKEWVEDGILSAPNASETFKVGNCLVENRFGPRGMNTSHEFVIVGSEEEIERIAKTLAFRVPRIFGLPLKDFGKGSWYVEETFQVSPAFDLGNFTSIKEVSQSLKERTVSTPKERKI